MPHVVYSVIATLPDAPTRDRYVAWLADGHARAVVRAGALEASVLTLEGDLRVRVDYRFSDRSALDRYERVAAPALRAEGAAMFPPASGVRLERQIAHEHLHIAPSTAAGDRAL